MHVKKISLLAHTAVIALLGSASFTSFAYAQDNNMSSAPMDEIVVTARKRDESLTDIPVAVTAFSETAIEEAGFAGLDDISLQTTGFQFSNQGGQQPGRYNTQLRFRGMSTSQFSPTFATGALFIDGVYVLNGGTSLSLMDLQQVEVIKGPQSAYFGRNTFGGAVNYVTRNPSLEEFNGQIETSVTSRGTVDVSGIAEIPLVEDTLGISLSGRFYDKKGHYVATDGGRLGNEQTSTFNAAAYYEPSDNFSLKLRASYSQDDDGAPAGGFVSGPLNDTCTGTTITTGTGATASPVNYFCGAIPGIDDAVTATGQSVISTNTSIFPSRTVTSHNIAGIGDLFRFPARVATEDFIAVGFRNAPLPDGVPNVGDVGLERETVRLSAIGEYEFDSGYSVNFIAGYNDQKSNWIRDFDLTDRYNWFSRDPQSIEDFTTELRLTSPQDQKLRWLIGANYYEQTFITGGAGGDAATACFAFFATTSFANCAAGAVFTSTFDNTDESEVLGIFAAADYDITDQFTLSLEGRYQDDTLSKAGSLSVDGLSDNAISLKSKKFLPRVILRYQPTPDTNLYGSFSQGVLQGDVNTVVANADAQELAQYQAQVAGAAASTPEEELDAWEIGLKQSLMDGRAQVNLSGYYYEWKGIKGRSTAVVFETCDADNQGNANCAGVPLNDVAPIPNPRNVLVAGDATLWGLELESNAFITDDWTAGLNVTWAKNEYKDYLFNFVQPFAGFSNQKGNQQPRFPEWSGNFTSTYRKTLSNGWDGFLRADVIYFGEAFVDESNLAYTEDYFLVNSRLGMENDGWRWELFANNLFNEDAYAAGARWTDFSRPSNFATLTRNQGVAVSAQNKREFGVRLIADF